MYITYVVSKFEALKKHAMALQLVITEINSSFHVSIYHPSQFNPLFQVKEKTLTVSNMKHFLEINFVRKFHKLLSD